MSYGGAGVQRTSGLLVEMDAKPMPGVRVSAHGVVDPGAMLNHAVNGVMGAVAAHTTDVDTGNSALGAAAAAAAAAAATANAVSNLQDVIVTQHEQEQTASALQFKTASKSVLQLCGPSGNVEAFRRVELFAQLLTQLKSGFTTEEHIQATLMLEDLRGANDQVAEFSSRGTWYRLAGLAVLFVATAISMLTAMSVTQWSMDQLQWLLFGVSACNTVSGTLQRVKDTTHFPQLLAAAQRRQSALFATAEAFFSRTGDFEIADSRTRASCLHVQRQQTRAEFERVRMEATHGSSANFAREQPRDREHEAAT